MNKLPIEKRIQILSMLVEGSSMRSISRVVDVSINTVSKLLIDAGNACAKHHDETVRSVRAQRIQCDEIWSCCQSKEKNVAPTNKGVLGHGDVWTWTGIDADSKLICSYFVGDCGSRTAHVFMCDLADRLVDRVQLTTDGHAVYAKAVESAFGGDIDCTVLVKIFGQTAEGQRRYSPPECIGTERRRINGNSDPKHVSTGYDERQNLAMRMSMRRFTRMTNAFSKKIENHICALALYFTVYNFVRIHETLKTTPAMQAGVADRLWSMADVVALVEANEPLPKKRGPYRKRVSA